MGADLPEGPAREHVEATTTSEAPVPTRTITVIAHKIDSLELFVGTREIIITHRDEIYRLRLTAQNKLILTK
jgi:hemin uptake protein HemP